MRVEQDWAACKGQGSDRACNGTETVGNDNIVVAEINRLNVRARVVGGGCAGEIGPIESPLISERRRARGSHIERSVLTQKDNAVLWLRGYRRRVQAASEAANRDAVNIPSR